MSARSVHNASDFDHVAKTRVNSVIAAMVITSLPLILGMVVWLPGWLEQSGFAVTQVASF